MSERLDTLLTWLYQRINYEHQSPNTPDDLRLQTMRLLMKRLGNPELHYPVIHVAGTKGKGSVSCMIGQILSATGRRVGVYTSPHLESINQRISINGRSISDSELAQTLSQLEPIARQIDADAAGNGAIRPLTFFELITATGFLYFAIQRVDVVVLEVGMGGRLDSTNVCQPVVSVITNISFDHTFQLGNTLAKIAFEKAGIIKPTVPVISGATDEEPAAMIELVAKERAARLYVLDRDFGTCQLFNGKFDWNSFDKNEPIKLQNLQVGMLGLHQHRNAALALAVCQELNRQSWNISESHVRSGLANATLPGRTEMVSHCPVVMLDIAHNPASIQALLETLLQLTEWNNSCPKILVLAISKDKDVSSMISTLVPHFDKIIFTTFECNPRSRSPEELLAIASEIVTRNSNLEFATCEKSPHLHIQPTSYEAWELACQLAGSEGFICVTGSAFLVADLRPKLVVTKSGSERN
jgi:dihydrofolate synthase/folylpolyglutamate synthase